MQPVTISRYIYFLSLPLLLNGCATAVDCSQPIFNGITTAPPLGCSSGKPSAPPSASTPASAASLPVPAPAPVSTPASSSPAISEENFSAEQMIERGEKLLREGQAKIDEGRRMIKEGKRMLRKSEQGNNTIP